MPRRWRWRCGPPGPIGIGTAARRETALTVPAGTTLVAYTDGLIERRTLPLDAGIERVREAAIGGRGRERRTARRARLDEIIGVGGTDDDVALVAVRRLGPQLRRTFTAEPSAVAEARHEVTSFAHAHGFAQKMLGDLALAVSEACTNVVVHAYRDHPVPGPMHVAARMRRRARGDRGRRGRRRAPARGQPGRGARAADHGPHRRVLRGPRRAGRRRLPGPALRRPVARVREGRRL